MGWLDFGSQKNDPSSSLSELDHSLGSSYSAYMLNKARVSVLAREASEQFQLVKAKNRVEQARAMDPYFREMLALFERQQKIVSRMCSVCKEHRFKMAKSLAEADKNMMKTVGTLQRITQAVNDPAINRLQGLQEALSNHRQMEVSVLLPSLK